MLDPSTAISRALENGNEPHEFCRRLMEHYLAGDEADKTDLASALIVELAARVSIDRNAHSRIDGRKQTSSRRSTPGESCAAGGARNDEMGFAERDREDGQRGLQQAVNQA